MNPWSRGATVSTTHKARLRNSSIARRTGTLRIPWLPNPENDLLDFRMLSLWRNGNCTAPPCEGSTVRLTVDGISRTSHLCITNITLVFSESCIVAGMGFAPREG